MHKNTKNAKQFALGCAGMTAGIALMVLGAGHWFGVFVSCGLTILIFTQVLSSSDEKAARKVPFLVLFFLPLLMAQVVFSIYLPEPLDSARKLPNWCVVFMLMVWAVGLCWECWRYFRPRSQKNDDNVV